MPSSTGSLCSATPYVNAAIQVVYICTVVFQFILALGSRPKSSVISYVISFLIFAVVQVYRLINVVYLIKGLVHYRLDTNRDRKYAYINQYYSNVGDLTVYVTAASLFGVYVFGVRSFDP